MFSALLGGVTSAGLGLLGSAFANAQSRDSASEIARRNYRYSQQSLLESPSRYRQGLLNAGYNPLLAVTGGNVPIANPSMPTSSVSSDPSLQSAFQNMLTKKELDIKDEELKSIQALNAVEASPAVIQARRSAEVAKAEAETEDSELSAYEAAARADVHRTGVVDIGNKYRLRFTPVSRKVQSAYENALERSAYENSRGHAIFEDIDRSVGTAANALGAFWRPRIGYKRMK